MLDTQTVIVSTPANWVQDLAKTLQWPAVVAGAFWVGRCIQALETRAASLETRACEAEGHLKAIVERHFPTIHRLLAEIRGLLVHRDH